MAVLKFSRRQQVTGIANVKVTNSSDNKLMVRYTSFTGQMGSFVVDKNFRLRIEARNCDMQETHLSNYGIVFGNVEYAKVNNSLNVEGSVIDFRCPRGSIIVDNTIKVVYGPELKARNEAQYGLRHTGVDLPVKILRLDGKMMNLFVDASDIEIETVLFGDTKYIEVGNSLSVKGNIDKAVVGNIIKATMGYSKAKSTKTLQMEAEQRRKESESIVNNLFTGINK